MPANNKSGLVHYIAGKHPGKVGLLISPLKEGWAKGKPPFYMPYALDNGRFISWDEPAFFYMLKEAQKIHPPLWVVVPDVVGDAEKTFEMWDEYRSKILKFGFNLAFAAQDGMEPSDVPRSAYCCFVGGTTKWKLENAHKFKDVCEWFHIGRVNTPKRFQWAKDIGAHSVDGTGIFRSNENRDSFLKLCEGVEIVYKKPSKNNNRIDTERIEYELQKIGWTKTYFADKIGCSKQSLNYILKVGSLTAVDKIISVLNIPKEELVYEKTSPQEDSQAPAN